jgi:hypothetical protein
MGTPFAPSLKMMALLPSSIFQPLSSVQSEPFLNPGGLSQDDRAGVKYVKYQL